jgi:hypothetical protein
MPARLAGVRHSERCRYRQPIDALFPQCRDLERDNKKADNFFVFALDVEGALNWSSI